jgi:hypothetical protein
VVVVGRVTGGGEVSPSVEAPLDRELAILFEELLFVGIGLFVEDRVRVFGSDVAGVDPVQTSHAQPVGLSLRITLWVPDIRSTRREGSRGCILGG